MSYFLKFLITMGVIVVSMAIGYAARRLGWVKEQAARPMMTVVAVFGYPTIGFLSVWAIEVTATDAWLPALGALHLVLVTLIAMAAGRWLIADDPHRGLFALAAGISNLGPTMGGFVVYLLYGEAGLGRVGVYALMFTPMVVLLAYPVARHYSHHMERVPLARLYVRSLLDWRSIGLPVVLVAIGLSALRVPRPELIGQWHVVDVLMYALLVAAYFSIGLRLHAADVWSLRRMVVGLGVLRFLVSPAVGVGLLAGAQLLPAGMRFGTLNANVVLIESFVPTAVTVVAVANMFHLSPRSASALFVANTIVYVVGILPWVWLLFQPTG